MSILSDQWYTRLYRFICPSPTEERSRHPFLERMAALRCNPLLDSLKLYVSTESINNALTLHERRFDTSLSVRIARVKLSHGERYY
jgi:ubiquinone biosynthesis protein UbiJ